MKRLSWLILSFLSIGLCLFIFFMSGSDKINLIKADYYYKNNNPEQAIKFYEQAFEAGAGSPKAGYNYVSLLINSPLNALSQERLVKYIKNFPDDAASFKAKSFLTDMRYEIHGIYPENYISQATYNQKIIRWTDLPVTYTYVNPEKAPEYYVTETEKAFSDWQTELGSKVSFVRTDKNPKIVVRFNTVNTSVNDNEKYVAAYTKPIMSGNILKNMTIDYYVMTPAGGYYTENQVYNTALHEIGHALGFMGHSNSVKNVMYMSSDYKTVNDDIRKNLTNADINTMNLLYSIKPDISDTKNCTGEYTKYLVLGNDNDVINAKIKEARTYIKKAPHLPGGYIDLADAFVGQEEYYKAIKCLNKALSVARDNDTVCLIYYNLAYTHFLIADYEKAKSYLDKSGSIKNSESSINLLAEIYAATGAKAEAIGLYESLISKHPSNIEYVIALTNIYVRNKEYLNARKVLKEYVRKYPAEKNNPRLAPYGILRAFL